MAHLYVFTADKTHAAFTNTRNALQGLGHTVSASADTGSAATLASEWNAAVVASGSVSAIIVVRSTYQTQAAALSTVRTFIRDKWVAGVPLLLGGVEAGATAATDHHISMNLGLVADKGLITRDNADFSASFHTSATVQNPHPITTGLALDSTTSVVASNNWSLTCLNETNVPVVTKAPSYKMTIGAWPVGNTLITQTGNKSGQTVSPARAVLCTWLYAGQSDYTTAGKALIEQMIQWLITPSQALRLEGSSGGAETGNIYASITGNVKFSNARTLQTLGFFASSTAQHRLSVDGVQAALFNPAAAAARYTIRGLNIPFAAEQVRALKIELVSGSNIAAGWRDGTPGQYGELALGPWVGFSAHPTWVLGSTVSTGPALKWWDGAALQAVDTVKWWDGAALQTAEASGWWDGTAIQPLA